LKEGLFHWTDKLPGATTNHGVLKRHTEQKRKAWVAYFVK